jgi:hypothetical protein
LHATILACQYTGNPTHPGRLGPEGDRDLSSGAIGERLYGVHFPGGFGISRVYLGKEYEANAVSTGWMLANDDKTYRSLNELSQAIGTNTENVWRNWFYFEDGKRKPISEMRDQTLVTRE